MVQRLLIQRTQRTPALAAAFLAVCAGCSAESEIAPRTPVNAQLVEHEKMQNPDIRDGFLQVAQPSYVQEPQLPPPRRTVSLGYIGDDPVGRNEAPPTPHWSRPFPCHWTHTCGLIAPPHDPYAPYSIYPRPYGAPPPGYWPQQ